MKVSGFNSELYAQVSQSLQYQQVKTSEDGSRISVDLKQTSVYSFSQSRSSIGHASLSNALHNNVKLNNQQPEVSKAEEQESPFDYQKVADNVMNFVSKTILDAKKDGASDEDIESLLGQARQGINQGFAEAKDELEALGMMNEELESGINKAYDTLDTRLGELEQSLLGSQASGTEGARRTAAVTDFSHASSQTGDLTIRTKDGDVVMLNFENIQQFAQRTSLASQQQQGSGANGDSTLVESQQGEQAGYSAFDQLAANLDEDGNVTSFAYQDGHEKSYSSEEQYAFSNSDENGTRAVVGRTSFQHYESQNFAFSVEGELDEEELAAIGSLVNDLAQISDEFFNGDALKAFEMGLSLGYNEDELAGFSMNLQQVETTQLTQVYQDVAALAPQPNQLPASVAQPLQNYGQQITDVVQQGAQQLDSKDGIKALIEEMMNKQFDLIKEQLNASEQQFKNFNNSLVDKILA